VVILGLSGTIVEALESSVAPKGVQEAAEDVGFSIFFIESVGVSRTV
jgi:hypothetical protein